MSIESKLAGIIAEAPKGERELNPIEVVVLDEEMEENIRELQARIEELKSTGTIPADVLMELEETADALAEARREMREGAVVRVKN